MNIVPGHFVTVFPALVRIHGIVAGAQGIGPDAHQSRMVELHKNRAALLMHGLGDIPQPGDLVIGPNPQLIPGQPPLGTDAGGLLDDKPCTAPGQRPIVFHILRLYRAGFIGNMINHHRRNANAVPDPDAADAHRIEHIYRCHVVPSLESTKTMPISLS